MKTTKSLAQIAAEWRAKNSNETRKSSIACGKVFQYSAGEIKQEIIRQSELKINRISARELKYPSVKAYCRKLITERLENIATHIPSDGLSMGSYYYARIHFFKQNVASRWASGEVISSCYLAGRDDRTSEYAKSYGHKATHYTHNLELSLSQLKNIKIIGGLVTEIGGKIDRHITKVRTLQSTGKKQSYNIVWKDQYLTQDFHANTINQAREWRNQRAKNLNIERKAAQQKAEFQKYFDAAKNLFYGLEHSLHAGNCKEGTINFAGKKQLNLEYGYRGDFLLSVANGQTDFVKRMITKRAIELQTLNVS